MKNSIYIAALILGMTGGAYAGTAAEQLGLDKTDPAQVIAQVPAPVRVTNTAAVIKEAEAVLGNPAAFTVAQMGGVIESLDEVLGALARSSVEREQLCALRDAVDSAQRRKVRREMDVKMDPSAQPTIASVIKEAKAVLGNPAAFTVKQMGGVIYNLDEARGGLARSSAERKQLDALRDAVDSAQRRKVREELGVREEGYIGLTGNSLIVKAETSRIQALAEEVFYGRDLSSQVGEADEAGNINGEALVWHRTKGWVTVKKYPLEGIPDSPQAIESAKDYVIAQVEKETSFKITRSEEGLCGGAGPSYMVDIAIKGVPGSIKTYGILASELSSGAPGLMASDECRE